MTTIRPTNPSSAVKTVTAIISSKFIVEVGLALVIIEYTVAVVGGASEVSAVMGSPDGVELSVVGAVSTVSGVLLVVGGAALTVH